MKILIFISFILLTSCCISKEKDNNIAKEQPSIDSVSKVNGVKNNPMKADKMENIKIPANMRKIEGHLINAMTFGKRGANDKQINKVYVASDTIDYYMADFPIAVNDTIMEEVLKKENQGYNSKPNQVLFTTLLEIIELTVPKQNCMGESSEKFNNVELSHVNLDEDIENEILVYLDMQNCLSRALLCVLDKKDGKWFVIDTLEKQMRFGREAPRPSFSANVFTKVIYINQQWQWGGGGQSFNEEVCEYYKLIDGRLNLCLFVPSNIWWGIGIENPYHYQVTSNPQFLSKNEILVEFDYQFRVDGTLLTAMDTSFRDEALEEESNIIILSNKEMVSYIWNEKTKRYSPHFVPENRLNEQKIKSFFIDSEVYYKEAFAKDFQKVKTNGNSLQKRFFQKFKNAYKIE